MAKDQGLIVLAFGPIGSGKTSYISMLPEFFPHITVIDKDVLALGILEHIARCLEKNTGVKHEACELWSTDFYLSEARDQAYSLAFMIALENLGRGRIVIIQGNFAPHITSGSPLMHRFVDPEEYEKLPFNVAYMHFSCKNLEEQGERIRVRNDPRDKNLLISQDHLLSEINRLNLLNQEALTVLRSRVPKCPILELDTTRSDPKSVNFIFNELQQFIINNKKLAGESNNSPSPRPIMSFLSNRPGTAPGSINTTRRRSSSSTCLEQPNSVRSCSLERRRYSDTDLGELLSCSGSSISTMSDSGTPPSTGLKSSKQLPPRASGIDLPPPLLIWNGGVAATKKVRIASASAASDDDTQNNLLGIPNTLLQQLTM